MSASTDPAVAKLYRIAEAVALEACEAVQHGQEPWPLQYGEQEECCFAKTVVADYLNS